MATLVQAISDGFAAVGTKLKDVSAALAGKISQASIGVANGVASLGSDGKIPTSQLPDAVLGALKFQGPWNASTNTPAIPTVSSSNKGWYYIVQVAGSTSVGGVTDWLSGDWVVSTGTAWVKIDNTETVVSVNGKIGAVTLSKGDVGLPNVDNTSDANKPLATSSSPGLMSAAQYNKLMAFPSSFNAALLSSKLAFWDGLSDPTVSGNSYPSGAAYVGSAAWDSTETAVRLTAAINGQAGGLEWSFSQLSFEYVTFKFKAGGGNGADSTYFYCYSDTTPGTEEGTGTTAGYTVGFSEFKAKITLYWATMKLTEVVQANIADGQWKTVKIFIIDNRLVIYYEGSLVIDYRDVHGRNVSNTRFGFGARTGGLNNNHWIKGLSVEKYSYGSGGVTLTEF